MTTEPKVVKIKPNWELVDEDDFGNWFFEHTQVPRDYAPRNLKQRRKISKQIMQEIENRRKI